MDKWDKISIVIGITGFIVVFMVELSPTLFK